MMTMGYNGYVAGCSGDGVSEPVPMRRKHTMGAIAPFFVLRRKQILIFMSGGDANILNKHAIHRVVLNILTICITAVVFV